MRGKLISNKYQGSAVRDFQKIVSLGPWISSEYMNIIKLTIILNFIFSSILDNEIANQIDDLLSSDEDSDYDITYEGIRDQG